MHLIVSGSRNYGDYKALSAALKAEGRVKHIHVGDAKGADALALRFARERKVPVTVYCADDRKKDLPDHILVSDWRHGAYAGPARNKAMIDAAIVAATAAGDSVQMIAFLAEGSKGTANAIKCARGKKVAVKVIAVEG